MTQPPNNKLRVGLVVPHIFMQTNILPRVIFSPAVLALSLAEELTRQGAEVTLYSPGSVAVAAGIRNVTADLTGFEAELAARGDGYMDLLKKHPLTFVTLARQVQAQLVTTAYADANAGRLDVVHIYTNEEELALPMAQFCERPVVFTHHDPFNFLVRYRSVMPQYRHLNWLSVSLAQRAGMPADTNWVGNIYHGLAQDLFVPLAQPTRNYVLYMGRIIEPKGVHLAIAAVREYNRLHPADRLSLKIAGKHYAAGKDRYWTEQIEPQLDEHIEYVGFVNTVAGKQALLGNARALIMPSTFDEPFGLVMIEALACGTPVVGLASGAIPEVVRSGETGFVVERPNELAGAIAQVGQLDRRACRADFKARFTAERMAAEHLNGYKRLVAN